MKSIETAQSRATLDADGIVTTEPIDSQLPRSAEMVMDIVTAIAELVGETPRPILWIPGDAQLEPRGWQVLIERVETVAVAVAIVADEESSLRLGAFPRMADSLMLPVRVFAGEDEARGWLLEHVH